MVTPQEDLDSAFSATFATYMAEVLKSGTTKIALDLSGVSLVTSTCIHTIMKTYSAMRDKSGQFVISGCKPTVMAVFKLVQFDRIIKFVDSIDQIA